MEHYVIHPHFAECQQKYNKKELIALTLPQQKDYPLSNITHLK